VRKFGLAMATIVALVSVAPAYALGPNIVPIPEPSSSAQLVLGLVVLAGLALVARKRLSRNEAE
jgi:MYXO-CTERM domain-containing protein